MTSLISVAVSVALLLYAFHMKDFMVLMFSALVTFFVWGPWFHTMPELAIVMWFFSALQALLSVTMILESGGKSRGWSQFKEMWRNRRGT